MLMTLVTFAVPTFSSAQDTTSNLAGHWTLDETAGTTAANSAGSIDGTMNGGLNAGTNSVSGQVGRALNFDGIDDYINIAEDAAWDTPPLTVSFWVKLDTLPSISGEQATLVIKRHSSLPWYTWNILVHHTGPDADKLYFSMNDITSTLHVVASDNTLNINQWYHVTAVITPSLGAYLYVDGILQADSELLPSIGDSDDSLRFSNVSNRLDGQLDDVRFYSRALSAEDVNALYLGGPGSIIYNHTNNVMQYNDATDWIAMGKERYVPNAVNFDGTNDYLTRGGDLTGITDGKQVTGSVWFRRTTFGLGEVDEIYQSAGAAFRITIDVSDRLRVIGENAAGTQILSSIGPTITDNNWHHLVFSIDMADQPNSFIYLDNTDVTGFSIFTDDVLDFSTTAHAIGSNGTAANMLNADLADFWLDFGTYIDLSDADDRAKFIDASGNPVNLGASGQGALGIPPDIYLSGETNNWHTNKGSGGGFTENGAITDATIAPNDTIKNWLQVGNALNLAGSGRPGLAALDSNTVAFFDSTNDNLTTYSWDGTDWSQIGNALNLASSGVPGLAVLDTTTVAIFEATGDNLETYSWDGTDWSQIGNTLNLAGSGVPALATLNATTIAMIDSTNDNLTTYSWDSTDWSQVGNALNITGNRPAIARLNSTTIAHTNDQENLTTYSWDGTDWSQIGNTLNLAAVVTDPALTALDSNTVAFFDSTNDNLTTYSWDGTDWSLVTTGLSLLDVNAAATDRSALTALNSTMVAFIDDTNDQLLTYEFGARCSNPTNLEGALTYNTTSDQMQFCNGIEWIAMGPPGDGGSGCSNPAGTAGSLTYNTTFNRMQYCEGDEWIGVGNSGVNAALTFGLVGHWPMDETSGSVIADISGNGNNGVWTDGVNNDVAEETASGVVGTSIDFLNAADIITVADDPALDVSGPLTVAFWAYMNSFSGDPNYQEFVIKYGTSSASNYLIHTRATQALCVWQGASDCSTYTLPTAEWVHIAVVMNSATSSDLYINGAFEESLAEGYGPINNNPLTFGDYSGGSEELDGRMDDIRIYNRQLSSGEIQVLYNLVDCPNVGDVCADGSVYAGLTPDGNVRMYVPRCDSGMSWNGTTCTGTALSRRWNNGNTTDYTTVGTSLTQGKSNTAAIILADSDSATAGTQPHLAAQYCADLVVNSHSDWYLPARDEYSVLYTNRVSIGNFATQIYWTSSEAGALGTARRFSFNTGVSDVVFKANNYRVRCARTN